MDKCGRGEGYVGRGTGGDRESICHTSEEQAKRLRLVCFNTFFSIVRGVLCNYVSGTI